MSNVLSTLNDNGLEETTDTLGGSFLLESGAYKATIANAYVSAAKSGALSVTVLYDDIAIIISPEHNIYSPEHNTLPICLKKAYLGVGLLRL